MCDRTRMTRLTAKRRRWPRSWLGTSTRRPTRISSDKMLQSQRPLVARSSRKICGIPVQVEFWRFLARRSSIRRSWTPPRAVKRATQRVTSRTSACRVRRAKYRRRRGSNRISCPMARRPWRRSSLPSSMHWVSRSWTSCRRVRSKVGCASSSASTGTARRPGLRRPAGVARRLTPTWIGSTRTFPSSGPMSARSPGSTAATSTRRRCWPWSARRSKARRTTAARRTISTARSSGSTRRSPRRSTRAGCTRSWRTGCCSTRAISRFRTSRGTRPGTSRTPSSDGIRCRADSREKLRVTIASR